MSSTTVSFDGVGALTGLSTARSGPRDLRCRYRRGERIRGSTGALGNDGRPAGACQRDLTVVRLRTEDEADEQLHGRTEFANGLIELSVSRETASGTIHEELGHLAIAVLNEGGEDVPITSEEF